MLAPRRRAAAALPIARPATGRQTTQVRVPGVRLFGAETVATVFLADGPGTGNIPGIDGYLGVASLKAKRVEFDFADRILRWR